VGADPRPSRRESLKKSQWSVLGRDLVPRVQDAAVRPNKECRSLNAHVLASVHRLLLPHAPRTSDGVVSVREQREPESELLIKLPLPRRRVGTDADDQRTADTRLHIAEPAGLLGASRRIRLRVEVHEQRATAVGLEGEGPVELVGNLKRRGNGSGDEHAANLPAGPVANRVNGGADLRDILTHRVRTVLHESPHH